MAHLPDSERIAKTHNTARFFTEHRQISWVALLAVILWGVYGYMNMPRRKDPDIPVRIAVAMCSWPGVAAEKVEQLVTRPIEQAIAENANIHPSTASDFGIKSTTLPGLAIVTVSLSENVQDTKNELNDISLKLNALNRSLPQGAGPIRFLSDFGDTAALTLTVASPRIDSVEVAVRAQAMRQAIERVRSTLPNSGRGRVTSIYGFPASVPGEVIREPFRVFMRYAEAQGAIRNDRLIEGSGFIGMDGVSDRTDEQLRELGERYIRERLQPSEIHPDFWGGLVVRDPAETAERLAAVAGDKYSYAQMDDFTDLIARTLQSIPEVSKVSRSGVLPEQIVLQYSQERLASYGVRPSNLSDVLSARNTSLTGGVLEAGGKNLAIDPTGEFQNEKEIGDVIIPSSGRNPVYLRDLTEIGRTYQSPARYLNFYTYRDQEGNWRRSRAVTLAVQMRSGEQIERFGESVNERLASVRQLLPEDLILARTSDQPLQVEENIELFMDALYEAILLVVIVSLIGFWEWRSAVLMALAIPITLAMSFGMMHVLGIDLQQVSIASLIIALGLLVDDPVVAGDAIKRDLAMGHPSVISAWLGPTKLATAIMYATVTNIVAYLPFMMLSGNTGDFLYSLPIVMTCTLVASRLVSMTFIPLLGYYLLRPKAELPVEERRGKGFAGFYYRVGRWAIHHRWKVATASLAFIALGGWFGSQLKSQYFPMDLQYLSYLDIWLPNDATVTSTNQAALQAEELVRQAAEEFGRRHPDADGQPRRVLKSLTTFVGGGGPRFWFSVSPELQQMNYAQVIIEATDKEDTPELVAELQQALSSAVPGARVDVQQLQTNPVQFPVEIMISGRADVSSSELQAQTLTLRALAAQAKSILAVVPTASRIRDDWGEESFVVRLEVDSDRANLAGVTNLDVAASSATAISGYQVATLREGDKQIPVVARLRMDERTALADVQNLYVYASQGSQKVPLRSVSSVLYETQTQKIQRRDHFRTISVLAYPAGGALASEVLAAAMPRLEELERNLPPGYTMEIGGEKAKQESGFLELGMVMGISVGLIFLALVMQFKHAIKPFLVFAAIPYGIVGALAALWAMGVPFGFMAFLGIASLVGVIVSHVIVLFDFIEEKHEEGEKLENALLDAGIMRLRPVMITVGATVIALIPLAMHGGPLWEPLCYAQIGGLTVATFITLLLVPVLYAIFVLDLKIVRWTDIHTSTGD